MGTELIVMVETVSKCFSIAGDACLTRLRQFTH